MEMTAEEIRNFLSQPLVALIATIRGSRPHIAPIWFLYDGKHLHMTTRANAAKVKNIKRNPHVAVVIHLSEGPYSHKRVTIEGTARISPDPEKTMSRAIYRRYMSEEMIQAPETQAHLAFDRVIITVRSTKIISWDGAKPPGS